MIQVESMIEPHGILNYFGWETVALVHFRLGRTPGPTDWELTYVGSPAYSHGC
jgi:hypothetical protein